MNYFSRLSNKEVELLLSTIEDGAYYSKRDRCAVILVKCQECSRMFEDEVNAFREGVIARRAVLCLDCDTDADAPALSSIAVRISWLS